MLLQASTYVCQLTQDGSHMDDIPHQEPHEPSPPPTAEAFAIAPAPPPVPPGLRDIGRKWLNVTTRPVVATFARELPTANWRDILLSLVGLGFLSAITRYFSNYSLAQIVGTSHWNGEVAGVLIPRWVASATNIVLQPFAFFFVVGFLFIAAKGLGGKGSFLEHAYAMALLYVPLSIAIIIVDYAPVIGSLARTILNIYELVLMVLALAASHRFTLGRSVLVVVVTPILLLLAILVVGIVYEIFAIAFHAIPSPH